MNTKSRFAMATVAALAVTFLGGVGAAGVAPAQAVACEPGWDCFYYSTDHPDHTSYTLTEDIAGQGPVVLGGTKSFTIDLAGYDLTITGKPGAGSSTATGALVVPAGTALTVTDSSPGQTGTLTATAADYSTYPGIGGRPGEVAGAITIAGGTVNATGSQKYNNDGGAGIGAGHRGSASEITITGGTVIAHGGSPSAGIGSSTYGSAGLIKISGGVVRASSTGAPGIGSGILTQSGTPYDGGRVEVSGRADVTATGGGNSPGIGSGDGAESFGSMLFLAGTVRAIAGPWGPALGAGAGGNAGEIIVSPGAAVTLQGSPGNSAIGTGLNSVYPGLIRVDGTLVVSAGSSLLLNDGYQMSVTGTVRNEGYLRLWGGLDLTGAGLVSNDGIIHALNGTVDPQRVTENNFVVSFDPQNGSPVVQQRVYAPSYSESDHTVPSGLVREHSTFLGWSANGAPWQGTQLLTGDLTVTAEWEVHEQPFTGQTVVAVAGDARVGEQVAASIVQAPVPAPTSYSYQWRADGQSIAGATAAALTVTPELANRELSVMALPVRAGYTADDVIGYSQPVTVALGVLQGELEVTVSGVAQVGNTVSAVVRESLSPAAQLQYSWTLNGETVAGATGPSFEIPSGAGTANLVAQVRAVANGYEPRVANSAAQYVLPARQASLTADRVTAGGSLTVNGVGFGVGEVLTVTLHSDPVVLGTVRVNEHGALSGVFLLPSNTAPGAHHIVVTDAAGVELARIPVTVDASAVPTPVEPEATGLARTGAAEAETGVWALSFALVLLGAVLVVRSRRHLAVVSHGTETR